MVFGYYCLCVSVWFVGMLSLIWAIRLVGRVGLVPFPACLEWVLHGRMLLWVWVIGGLFA